MRLRLQSLVWYLLIFPALGYGQDCNIRSKANDINPDQLCSPVQVVTWEVSYVDVNDAGTLVEIRFDWDDGDVETIAATEIDPVNSEWGKSPKDHFGYTSDEERLSKRGLEDWELVNTIPESQRKVPVWFIAVVVVVLLVAIGLSFPFWGNRPGYERDWINWGFGAALLYLAVFGTFVYFMVNKYSPSVDGMESGEDGKENSSNETITQKQNSSDKTENPQT